MSLLIWILLFCLLGGVLSVVAAAVFLLLPETWRSRLLPHAVSFAIGALLGAALLGLLPHALAGVGGNDFHAITGAVLLGLFGFFLLEKLVLWRHCHDRDCEVHGQAAPLILFGLYWPRSTRRGAIIGLAAGFALWCYTLFLPTLGRLGAFSDAFIDNGPFGLAWLRPEALLFAGGASPLTHGVAWSLGINVTAGQQLAFVLRSNGTEMTVGVSASDNYAGGDGVRDLPDGAIWAQQLRKFYLLQIIPDVAPGILIGVLDDPLQ
mgnify:CR=1 FL=1